MNVAGTLSADLAVAVGVTGLQEGGGLGVGQCAGTGLEILQEKPSEEKNIYIRYFQRKHAVVLDAPVFLTSAPPPR